MKKRRQYLTALWKLTMLANLHIIEIQKGEEREKGAQRLCEEIMSENFLKLVKDMNLCIQEGQQTLGRINSKRLTPGHITIKPTKPKRVLKAPRKK